MQLALLPEPDKVVSFDAVARVVESLPAALDRATPDQVKQLLALLAEEVKTHGPAVSEIKLRPEAKPFFRPAPGDLVLAPRTDSNPQQQRNSLDYYLEVG